MTSFAFGNFADLWCCSQQRVDVASVTDWHMGRMKKAFVDSSSKQLVSDDFKGYGDAFEKRHQ